MRPSLQLPFEMYAKLQVGLSCQRNLITTGVDRSESLRVRVRPSKQKNPQGSNGSLNIVHQEKLEQGVERLRGTLLSRATTFESLGEIFELVCVFLREVGLQPHRVSLVLLPGVRSLDGRQLVWRASKPDDIERLFFPAGFAQSQEHRESVLVSVMTSCEPSHITGDDVEAIGTYPFIRTLFDQGVTEYVAVPLRTRRQSVHVLSVTTERAGGWPHPPTDALSTIGEVLALLVESFEVSELFEERDLMLRELNHRVKNNLSLSSSLLRIQARQFDDEEVVRAFEQSATRIESVAMVHAQLYARDRLTDLELGAYAQDLVPGLVATQDQPFRVQFDVEVIFARVDQAVPIALILNELVTNALKHGRCMKPGSDSKYDIHIAIRLSDRGVRLTVGNWVGDGQKPRVDDRLESFGETMIEAFARRLSCQRTSGLHPGGWYEVDLDFGIRDLLPGLAQRTG